MSEISDETICTNCGKPYGKHFHERDDEWVYCYEDTNGDFFTTEPTPEMIQEAEVARLREACIKTNDEICQTLGKALGYPWFKDDPKNFPGATEENGVCTGDHVAESIAMEAARTIGELRSENARLRAAHGHQQQEISVMSDREIAAGCVDDYYWQAEQLDKLRQENERLRAAMGVENHETVDSSGHGWVRVTTPGGDLRRISPVDERVVELERENDRLRKDAERLDWIDQNGTTTLELHVGGIGTGPRVGDYWKVNDDGRFCQTLRAAIDAAMEEAE